MDIFKYYNHLGFFNPYYYDDGKNIAIEKNISDIFKYKNTKNQLDVSSLVSTLSKGHCLGNRTMVKNVLKTPWLAKYDDSKSGWDYHTQLEFGNKIKNPGEIAETFFELLKKEILRFIGKKKNIGILLTGGMDSRMIAGALDTLIDEHSMHDVNIVAYTWGCKECRDVVYAQKIAKRFKWDWKHFEISPEDMYNNIIVSGERGSEYSPAHLHAMIKVSKEEGIDGILAGSFGDSIGRAEYSGRKADQLKDIRTGIDNRFKILKKGVIKHALPEINKEIIDNWHLYPQEKMFQQIEQDYQMHYMRRMLTPCMSVINDEIPVYQCFTDPKLVNLMWSFDVKVRDNSIYKELLKLFRTDISDIPWARTGLLFDETNGEPDKFKKSYDSYHYSKIINGELFDYVRDLVLSDNLRQLNVFNHHSLTKIFKLMKSPLYRYNIKLEERLIWLASLSLFVDKYNVENTHHEFSESYLSSEINSYTIYKEKLIFDAKFYYRKHFLKIDI